LEGLILEFDAQPMPSQLTCALVNLECSEPEGRGRVSRVHGTVPFMCGKP
jgi:hypothetical protein